MHLTQSNLTQQAVWQPTERPQEPCGGSHLEQDLMQTSEHCTYTRTANNVRFMRDMIPPKNACR